MPISRARIVAHLTNVIAARCLGSSRDAPAFMGPGPRWHEPLAGFDSKPRPEEPPKAASRRAATLRDARYARSLREDLQSPQGKSRLPCERLGHRLPPDAVTELQACERMAPSLCVNSFARGHSHAIGGRADLWRSRRLHRSDAIERPRTLTILARCQMARILGQSCPADSLSLPPTLPNSGLKHAIYERSVFSAKKWFRKLARDALGERRIAARTMS